MGHAGRQLADRRELLGTKHLAFALPEPIDDGPIRSLSQRVFDPLEIGIGGESDGADDLVEPTGRVADGHADLDQPPVDAPGHAETCQQAGAEPQIPSRSRPHASRSAKI